MRDLIIIGGGPAGLSAAAHAADMRVRFLLISKDLGGKCNYRLRLTETAEHATPTDPAETGVTDLVAGFQSLLENLRHSYRLETVESVEHEGGAFSVTTDKGTTEKSRAVLVATGARAARLRVPGELKYLSRTLGYSATSHARLLEDRRVFLAGDSDRVLRSAIRIAARSESVTLLLVKDHRCSQNALEHAQSLDNVHLITDGTIDEFRDAGAVMEAVVSTADGGTVVAADACFLETELKGDSRFIRNTEALGDDGYFAVDPRFMTRIPGLFAAGDVTGNSSEEALAALGQGVAAMHHLHSYLVDNSVRRDS